MSTKQAPSTCYMRAFFFSGRRMLKANFLSRHPSPPGTTTPTSSRSKLATSSPSVAQVSGEVMFALGPALMVVGARRWRQCSHSCRRKNASSMSTCLLGLYPRSAAGHSNVSSITQATTSSMRHKSGDSELKTGCKASALNNDCSSCACAFVTTAMPARRFLMGSSRHMSTTASAQATPQLPP